MTTATTTTSWFTPQTASKTLPLVKAILTDIRDLHLSIRERNERIARMMSARGETTGSPYQDELSAMRRSLESDRQRIREYIGELVALGVYLVDENYDSVEFPTWVENRAARLCWTLDQPSVTSWREIGDATTTRRELASTKFGDGPDISLLGDLEDSAR